MRQIEVASDFSGVGAFEQALMRLKLNYKTVFACDIDKYARNTYLDNYDNPDYFPTDVYNRKIPKKSLDIYMTSPPCQSFSIAGKRKGENDERGLLFYNSHDFIKKNKPRYFIFENVKGLLSDNSGGTFRRWIDYLGGKSMNGMVNLIPHEKSVPYHIYYKVLNAKKYGVPQNRERIFIIGIRDDDDNNFKFPKETPLKKSLKDILEDKIDEKYYLNDEMVSNLIAYNKRQIKNNNGFSAKFRDIENVKVMDTLKVGGRGKDDLIKVAYINQDTQASQVYSSDGVSPNICAGTHGYANGYVQIGAIRGRGENKKTKQTLEVNKKGTSNALTTVPKNNVVVESGTWRTHKKNKGFRKISDGNCPTIPARAREDGSGQPVVKIDKKIRRLTPREAFRLMDFPEEFKMSCSDTQMYKQAGNSIVVVLLEKIIKQLNLK